MIQHLQIYLHHWNSYIQTGEKVRVFSDDGDLPENIESNTVYFAIRISSTEIKLASSVTNAQNNVAITVFGGTKLFVESRVSDKSSGDIGSPIQFDPINKNWFIHVDTDKYIYPELASQGVNGLTEKSNVTTISRTVDPRSLDERLYTVRVVVPKEAQTQKILMMDLLFKNQAQVVFEQALISHLEQLMQVMYSLIVIQDLLVLVLHLEDCFS